MKIIIKKTILIFFILSVFSELSCANVNSYTCDDYILDMEYIFYTRATIYNTLNLTDEQISIQEEIINKNIDYYSEKFSQLTEECAELDALTKSDASSFKIFKQKNKIKKLQKKIDEKFWKDSKKFLKHLNKRQRYVYKTIIKLNRRDMNSKPKDYYKLNPELQKF